MRQYVLLLAAVLSLSTMALAQPFIIRVNTAVGTGAGTLGASSNTATPSGQFFLRAGAPTTGVNITVKDITGTTTLKTYTNVSAGLLIKNTDWGGAQTQYQIEYTGVTSFQFFNAGDRLKLSSVEQWGSAVWTSFANAFYNCANMQLNASDAPVLTAGPSLSNMFVGCTVFTGNASMATWNVGAVTNMGAMFQNSPAFNQNIGSWTTGNVTNMGNMFFNCTAFNQDISGWDVGKVTSFAGMFQNTGAFNRDLSTWNVSEGTDFSSMFASAAAYTNLGVSLNTWNPVKAEDLNSMFSGTCKYNMPLNGNWCGPTLVGVTNMASMFVNNAVFNQDLSCWNVSTVKFFNNMFQNADAFNQDLSSWNVSAGINFSGMFSGADVFTNAGVSLRTWNPVNATNLSSMFSGTCKYNLPLDGNWCGTTLVDVTNMTSMFQGNTVFNQDLSCWNVSTVQFFGSMFQSTTAFNQNLSSWNVSAGTNFTGMFNDASAFDNTGVSLNTWVPSAATNMSYMFANDCKYNMPLDGGWCGTALNEVTDMTGMFQTNKVFNQDLSCWDVSAVQDFSYMFDGTTVFNRDLSSWNVSAGKTFQNMFNNAAAFTNLGVSLSPWNPTSANIMQGMFANACKYNMPLNWCGSKLNGVTNMYVMFVGNTVFNQDISCWDVSTVTNFQQMFQNATAFNNLGVDLATPWNTTAATNMQSMFDGATAFNLSLAGLEINNVTNMAAMLNDNGMSEANYDATLIGWQGATHKTGVTLGSIGRSYCASFPQRRSLIVTDGWIISGDTQSCAPGGIATNLIWWLDATYLTQNGGSTVSSGAIDSWGSRLIANSIPYNVTQPTGASQPTLVANNLNFNPVMRFDGVNDKLSSANLLSGYRTTTGGYTVFTVGRFSGSGAPIVSHERSAATEVRSNVTTSGITLVNSGATASYAATAPLSGLQLGAYSIQPRTGAAVGSFSAFLNGVANGTSVIPNTAPAQPAATGDYLVGGNLAGTSFLNGDLAEVSVYSIASQTATNRRRIETYLAIKWGLTLAVGTAYNYESSGGTTVWTGNALWQNNVIGIGRDDLTTLNQQISRSQLAGDVITLSTNNNYTGANGTHTALSTNGSYLIMGHNNFPVSTTQTSDMPASLCGQRTAREWRTQNTNFLTQTANLAIDVSSFVPASRPAADILLLIDQDGDGDFTTGTVRQIAASSVTSGTASFENLVFDTDASGSDVYTVAIWGGFGDIPALSTNSLNNVCPALTVSLTGITVSNLPTGGTLTWHSSATATVANRLSNLTAVTTGTYYAAYYDAASGCYRPGVSSALVVLIRPCLVITNDAGTVTTGGSLTLGLLANDTYNGSGVNSASVTVSVQVPGGTGTATVNAAGILSYTPAVGFTGPVTFTYTVCDVAQTTVCVSGLVNLTVVNVVLVATADNLTLTSGSSSPVTVLANDTRNGSPASVATVTVSITGPPASGTAVVNGDGSISYTASLTYTGTTSFTYTICDVSAPGICASAVVSVTVSCPVIAAPVLSVVQPGCTLATGTITVTAPLGLSYSLDGVSYSNTSGSFTGVAAGSYTVTAKNAAGCISTGTALTINAQPSTPTTPVVSLVQPSCTLATGTITVTAPLGLSYSIDGLSYSNTSGSFTGVAAGSYTLTAQNASGCISPGTALTLTAQPPTPTTPTASLIQPSCTLATGTITVTAPLGLTYSIDGVSYSNTSGSFAGVSAGNYTLTAKNTSGCISTGTALTINAQPSTPTTPTVSLVQPSCTLATGTITVTAPLGLSYSLDGLSYSNTSGSFPGIAAGSYTLTAKNTSGCISTGTALTLTAQPPTPTTPTASLVQPSCTLATGTITVTAPLGLSYSIDGVSYSNTSGSFTGVSAGSYTLTAKNASGCISTGTALTINAQPPTPTTPTVSLIQPSCTLATGTITVTAPLGLSYSLDGVSYSNTSGSFAGLSAGSYTLTAQNASGCVSPGTALTLTAQPPTPTTPTASLVQPSCTLATGTITVTAPLGLSYSIDGLSYSNTSGSFAGVAAGSYTLTAKNASGCISTGTALTLTAQPPTPTTPTASLVQPSCTLATGTITVTAPLGLSYSIDGVSYSNTSGSFAGVSAGSYTLTAQNASGCISAGTALTITAQPGTPTTPVVSLLQPSCTLATGTITVTSPVGAGLSYSIDGVSYSNTSGSFTGVAAGSYTLTARSSGGCLSAPTPVSLTPQPPSPVAATVDLVHPTCTLATGSITVTAPLGLTYSIDGVDFSNTSGVFSNVPGGSYTVTVQNEYGCRTASPTRLIPQPPPPPVVSIVQPGCSVATGTLTVSDPLELGMTYSLDGSDYSNTSAVFTGVVAGSYTITARSSLGCTSNGTSLTVTAQPPSPVAPTVSVVQPSCTLATGTITVTTPLGLSYSIDGVSYSNTSGSFAGVAAGSYTVSVQNGVGCTAGTSVTVTAQPPTPTTPVVSLIQPSCTLATGTITVTAPLGLSYSIDGLSYSNTSGSFGGLSAGSYTVTAQNAVGCISLGTALTLTAQPPTPTTPVVSLVQPSCTLATGTITVTAPLGLSYSIDGVSYSNTSGSFAGVAAGSYTVTAKNSSGCISAGTALTLTAQPPTPTTPVVSLVQPSCTLATGTITVTAPLGLSYSIDGLSYSNTSGSFPGIAAGSYTLTAKNSSGCISLGTALTLTAQPPTPVAPSVSLLQPSCTLATGTITVTSPLGLSYSLDGLSYSNTSGSFAGVAAGSYTVTAKNASGCISPGTALTITAQPPSPSAPVVSLVQPSCTLATGSITVTAPLGLSYSIDGVTYSNTSGIFPGLSTGSYTVWTKNAVGCISSLPVVIQSQPLTPVAPVVSVLQPGCVLSTGTITVTAPVGAGLSYSIDGVNYSNTSGVFPGLSTGSYTVRAKNSSGCISPGTVAVVDAQPQPPSTPVVSVLQPSCTSATGSVTVTSPVGNSQRYTLNLNSVFYSNTTGVFTGLVPGEYTLRVQSSAGCSAPLVGVNILAAPPAAEAPVVSVVQPGCSVATGSIVVTAPLGLSYSIDGLSYGNTSGSFTGVSPGSYTVSARNASGCISLGTVVSLSVPPSSPPAPVLSVVQPSCTLATGSITVTAPLGLSYSIDGLSYNNTSGRFPGLPAGSYLVSARNASGCVSAPAPVSLQAQPLTPPAPVVSVVEPGCSVATGSILVTTVAGLSYSLDGLTYSNTGGSFTGVSPGSYTVSAQNASGCISLGTVVSLQAAPLVPSAPVVSVVQPSCSVATGSILVTAVVGLSYSLDGLSYSNTSGSFTGVSPGSYTVSARNASGCISLGTVVSLQAAPLVPSAPVVSVLQPSCSVATGSIVATAGAGLSYSLDGLTYTGGSFTGVSPGSYTVTAKNTSGCVSAPTLVSLQDQPLTPVAPVVSVVQPSCSVATGSILVTPVAGLSYSIDGLSYSNTSGSFTGVSPGSYTVSVRSSAGCVSLGTVVNLSVPPSSPPAPVVSVVQPSCTLSTGSILVTAGAGLSYSIDGLSYSNTSGSFTGVSPGSYTVSVRSSAGCISLGTVVSLQATPLVPSAPVVSVVQPSCSVATGSILVTPGAGLSYSIDGLSYSNTSGSFTGVSPGSYTVSVRSSAGCVSLGTVVSLQAAPSVPSPAPVVSLLQPGCSVTTGSISVIAPVGAGLSYSIDGLSYSNTSGSFTGVSPGSYTVSVRSSAGCVSLGTVVSLQAAPSVPSAPVVSVVQPSCTLSTGSILVTTVAGLSYSIDGLSYNSGSFTGVSPGSYTLTAQNASGCVSLGTVVSLQAAPLVPSAPVVSVVQPSCSVATGSILVTTVAGLSYSIDGLTYSNTSGSFTGVSPGSYTVSARSSAGCISVPVVVNLTRPLCPVVARPDAFTAGYNTTLSLAVLANDSDPAGHPASLSTVSLPFLITQPSAGTALVGTDGTISFTPRAGFQGTTSFVYGLCALAEGTTCGTALVSITVEGKAPDAVDDAAVVTLVNTPVTVAVLANDRDRNGDPATLATVSLPVLLAGPVLSSGASRLLTPPAATAVVGADGRITVIPPTDWVGVITLRYALCDRAGSGETSAYCDEATLTVRVQGRPPLAVADQIITLAGGVVTVDLLANDRDGAGNAATLATVTVPVLVGVPAHGQAVISPTGVLSYTAEAGFVGSVTIVYQICDRLDASQCSTAWLVLSVSDPCAAGQGSPLRISRVVLNCYTDEICLETCGGDGTPIQYFGIGVGNWGYEKCVMIGDDLVHRDPKVVVLKANQSGSEATFIYDLPTVSGQCPDASRPWNRNPASGTPPPGIVVSLPGSPTGATGLALSLLEPGYNCTTGALSFRYSGGDGSPVEYFAEGVTGWSADPIHLVESRLRLEQPTIVLQARQSGVLVSRVFAMQAYCQAYTPVIPPGSATVSTPATGTGSSPDSGTAPITGTGVFRLMDPLYNCSTGAFRFRWDGNTSGPVEFMAVGITAWSPNANQVVAEALRGDANVGEFTLWARQNGQLVSYRWNLQYFCSQVGVVSPPVGTTGGVPVSATPVLGTSLSLVAPAYDCVTGQFGFRYLGGDGSAVEFMAVGITGWSTQAGWYTVKPAGDVTSFVLVGRQGGQTVQYLWDWQGACPKVSVPVGPVVESPPVSVSGGSELVLLAPLYDCASGRFSFQVQGGDGSSVRYMAMGITAWSSEPTHVLDVTQRQALAEDRVTLFAFQSGKLVERSWSLSASCGAGRMGDGSVGELTVRVLGNPTLSETVEIEVGGAVGALDLSLSDLQGTELWRRQVDTVAGVNRYRLSLGGSSGVYVLRVRSGPRWKVLKIVRH